jgi:hypothetical protein
MVSSIGIAMRDKIIFILPFFQVIIALVTLSKIPEPPPQYFCKQAQDTYGNYADFIICNPQ